MDSLKRCNGFPASPLPPSLASLGQSVVDSPTLATPPASLSPGESTALLAALTFERPAYEATTPGFEPLEVAAPERPSEAADPERLSGSKKSSVVPRELYILTVFMNYA